VTNAKSVKHATVSVLVFTTEEPAKVLLLHHKKTGKWHTPGGHVEGTENPLETAVREVKADAAIDLTPYLGISSAIDERTVLLPRPQYLIEAQMPAHGKDREHYHLDMMYVVRIPEQSVASKAKGAHDIGWFDESQLDSLPMAMNVLTLVKQEIAHA
jgi:8-oxo-dGTP diphosphatase